MQLTNRTFIRADYSLFWNHSLSEWFSLYKTAAPGPCREDGGVVSELHQEQHPRLGLDGYGFRILCSPPEPAA